MAFYKFRSFSHNLYCFRLLFPQMSHIWDLVKADALTICHRRRCSVRPLYLQYRLSLREGFQHISACLSLWVGRWCLAPESDTHKQDNWNG